MFDWDEEELSNMIWGDNGETGDHIVPFKVRTEQLNKKEQNEDSKTIKTARSNVECQDSKLGSSSGHNVDEGIAQSDFCMNSWLDSSLSDAREADPSSSGAELSKCLEKTSELGKGLDIFHSTDESKEQGDFDDYGWANIGSFDDLDRMFSNDVPIFGDGSLSGTDELWSSSKDVSKSLPSVLDSQDLGLDIRTEFEQQENQQFPLIGKADGPSSQSVSSVHEAAKAESFREHKGQPSAEDQPYQQSKMMKISKMSTMSEAGAFQLHGQRTQPRNSPGKFVNQLAPSRSSLTDVNLQSESQGSGTSHYHRYMCTSGFGNNLTNPYATTTLPVLSAVQCPDVKNQLIHPSYNPAMVTDPSSRPSSMTPQEKLEKLRRRQQMQAMLAIQRQEQQLRHQVPVADNPVQLVDKTNLQGLAAMSAFDPSTSLELDDSGNFSAGVDNSTEFSVLYRLQDVVAKLDMGTRTCIRDSLFRLAGSAAQRHHTSKKTSQDDQEVIQKKESGYRYADEIPDKETVTNPTDRVVAHLLFHRPFDILAARHMEKPESPASSKIGTEEKEKLPNRSTQEEEEVVHATKSGSRSNVGESVAEVSQGTKRKM